MCPSFLFFDVADASRLQQYARVFATVYAHPEERLMDEAGTSIGYIDDRLFFFTVRGTAAVKGYGLMGQEGLIRNGSEWTVPIGSDYTPLFRFGYLAEVQEESFTVPVEFTKEYAHVTVQYLGAETFEHAGGRFPFYITVRGNTCGIDALTGAPVTGAFACAAEETEAGVFRLILPRQADDQLLLELYGKPGLYPVEGLAHSYNLGGIMREMGGITWQEKNLPDILIGINFKTTDFRVEVIPWEQENIDYEY